MFLYQSTSHKLKRINFFSRKIWLGGIFNYIKYLFYFKKNKNFYYYVSSVRTKQRIIKKYFLIKKHIPFNLMLFGRQK
jgi:hypothetical protein